MSVEVEGDVPGERAVRSVEDEDNTLPSEVRDRVAELDGYVRVGAGPRAVGARWVDGGDVRNKASALRILSKIV